MTERPIIFSAPMVLALREGRKTQTRRTRGLDKINAEPDGWHYCGTMDDGRHEFRAAGMGEFVKIKCPYGVAGDRLWTRETWTGTWLGNSRMHLHYAADGAERELIGPYEYVLPKAAATVGTWVTPLFLPRWASRDTLEVISARPERLHAITEADAIAEGFGPRSATSLFRGTWSVINGPDSWAKNPWIWRVAFKRLEAR